MKQQVTFDGILFESENDLINFLKHQYFANRTSIELLEAENIPKHCKNCVFFNWKLSGSKNWGECINPKVLPLIRVSTRLIELEYKTTDDYRKARQEIDNYIRVQFDEDNFGCIYFEDRRNQ